VTSKRLRPRLPGHPALRFGALALVALVVAFAVVRSSPANSSQQSDLDPRVFAGKFLSTGFGVLIGTGAPADVLQLYTPACATGETGARLKQDMQQSRQVIADDKRVKVDGVEFGDGFEFGMRPNGYVVTLPGSKNIRLHVNGEWVSAHDQLETLGLEQADDGDAIGQLALEYVDGKLRVASC
jgi:hypothetical protein